MDRKLLAAVVVAFGVGYWWSASSQPPSPWSPANDRPVLRWIARISKSLLWVAVFAEQPPAENRLVHAQPVGEDGFPAVDHGAGW